MTGGPHPAERRRTLTIRARLTLTYAGLVTGCGAVLIAFVYLYMRFVPIYQIEPLTHGTHSGSGPEPIQPTTGTISIHSAEDFLDNLLIASVSALVLLAVLGGAVGWLMAGRIIRPLAVINAAANRASTGTLDHRISLDGPDDEIHDLAYTFDRMLASLERSFAAHRRFAANASHELRTPLATTKTMIDVALADPDADRAELRRLAERVGEVNRASVETVDALLDLAEADSGTAARVPVDLTTMAHDVVAQLADEAVAVDVDLTAEGPPCVALGDPVLLRQAVTNLVRNAIRHNVPAGHATVRVTTDHDRAYVTVTNTGPQVPRESLDALTEPFVRGAGRTLTRGTGHGLGLAIVSAVAAAHGGTLALHPNADGGLTVHLDLPRPAGAPEPAS
ncbi:sensor histidine kinase [Promicromonospora vindobonensis]|uniref:histidine kinase n=1 Tax=Promicromonospora vindobonensis TaxID=195748 RepID=A0ABW5W0H0_9MICO